MADVPALSVLLAAAPSEDSAAADTVRDLLRQTLYDLEIVIVAEAGVGLQAAAAADRRVRIVPPIAGPPGLALNAGLAAVRGEVVARTIPGDRSAPDRFERQLGLLRAAADLAFVGTGWRSVGLNGSVGAIVSPPAGDTALRAAMAAGDAIGHPTAAMRREAMVRAGGWRPAFSGKEDYDLLRRLMDRNAGACSPEPLVDHVTTQAGEDWRTQEQLILSELAAAAASDRRQAGRPDHGDQLAPADRGLLHRMGIVDEEITRTIARRARAMAVVAGSAGHWRAMREAATLGLRQPGLESDAKSQLRGLWLRSMTRLRPSTTPGELGIPPGMVGFT